MTEYEKLPPRLEEILAERMAGKPVLPPEDEAALQECVEELKVLMADEPLLPGEIVPWESEEAMDRIRRVTLYVNTILDYTNGKIS